MSVADEYVTHCPHCGGVIKAGHLAKKVDGLELYRCPVCGRDVGLTVSLGDTPPRLEETFDLLLEWPTERPSLIQIRAARELLPSLANIPLSELKRQMDAGRFFELGRFEGGEALDVMNRAKDLGLPIRTRRVLK